MMKGVTGALTMRLGPLPVWVWALIIGGGFLAFKALSGGSAPTGGESVVTNPDIDDDDEDGDVQLLPIAQAGPNPATTPPVDERGNILRGYTNRPGMPGGPPLVAVPAGKVVAGLVKPTETLRDFEAYLDAYEARYGNVFRR